MNEGQGLSGHLEGIIPCMCKYEDSPLKIRKLYKK